MGNTLYLILLIIISVLSLIGCSFLLLDYIQQRQYTSLATKLLAILSISDAIYVIAMIMNSTPQNNGAFCVIQALIKQSSSVSTFFVIFFFCFTTYLTIVENKDIKNDEYYKYQRNSKFFTILFPFFIALIPLTFHGYGIKQYACGFKTYDAYWVGEFLLFSIPFALLFGSSLYFLLKIKQFLREIQTSKQDHADNKNIRRTLISYNSQFIVGEHYTSLLLYYTMIHFFCWFPIILSSICEIIWKEDFLWLEGISYLCTCSQGFLDFILFIVSKRVSSRSQIMEFKDSILTVDPGDIYGGSIVYQSNL